MELEMKTRLELIKIRNGKGKREKNREEQIIISK